MTVEENGKGQFGKLGARHPHPGPLPQGRGDKRLRVGGGGGWVAEGAGEAGGLAGGEFADEGEVVGQDARGEVALADGLAGRAAHPG